MKKDIVRKSTHILLLFIWPTIFNSPESAKVKHLFFTLQVHSHTKHDRLEQQAHCSSGFLIFSLEVNNFSKSWLNVNWFLSKPIMFLSCSVCSRNSSLIWEAAWVLSKSVHFYGYAGHWLSAPEPSLLSGPVHPWLSDRKLCHLLATGGWE